MNYAFCSTFSTNHSLYQHLFYNLLPGCNFLDFTGDLKMIHVNI